MEERLAAYRASKSKENKPSWVRIGSNLFSRNRVSDSSTTGTKQTTTAVADNGHPLNGQINSTDHGITWDKLDENIDSIETEETVKSAPIISSESYLGRIFHTSNIPQFIVQVTLWVALFGLFVCLGFGAIFIILSLFYIIYANMRGETDKQPGEKSAYSVFNPNCERIHGTFTAEQFEKEMLYGIGAAVR